MDELEWGRRQKRNKMRQAREERRKKDKQKAAWPRPKPWEPRNLQKREQKHEKAEEKKRETIEEKKEVDDSKTMRTPRSSDWSQTTKPMEGNVKPSPQPPKSPLPKKRSSVDNINNKLSSPTRKNLTTSTVSVSPSPRRPQKQKQRRERTSIANSDSDSDDDFLSSSAIQQFFDGKKSSNRTNSGDKKSKNENKMIDTASLSPGAEKGRKRTSFSADVGSTDSSDDDLLAISQRLAAQKRAASLPRNPLTAEKRRQSNLFDEYINSYESHKHTEVNLWSDTDEEEQERRMLREKKKNKEKSNQTTPTCETKTRRSQSTGRRNQEDRSSYQAVENESGESDVDENSLKPYFEDPKLGPPSALAPLVLKNPVDETTQDEVPAAINRYLKPYQREGVAFMHGRVVTDQGCVLGDDMGLGKTVQVISLLAALLQKTGTGQDYAALKEREDETKQRMARQRAERDRRLLSGIITNTHNLPIEGSSPFAPVLVVVPPSVIQNWVNEFDTWGHFAVVAYHGTSRSLALDAVRDSLKEIMVCGKSVMQSENDVRDILKVKWKLIVADEFHQYKNFKTTAYKNLKQVKEASECPVIGLTGTMMQNNHEELWSQVDLIVPGFLGSLENFRMNASMPIKLARTKTAREDTIAKGHEVKEWLSNRLRSFYIHRTKAEVLGDDLPMKDETVLFCDLSPLQKLLYEHILSLPDYHLVKYSAAPCECGVNQRLFKAYRALRTEKEKVRFCRDNKKQIISRRQCCFQTPLNPERFDGGPIHDPAAVLWYYQHYDYSTGECDPCKTCPTCTLFPCLDKLYKLSSHAGLLQAPKHPDQCAKGSKSWKDATKTLEFAKVAIPPKCLSQMPGKGYVRMDSMMNDHSSLSGKMKMLSDILKVLDRRGSRVLLFSFSTMTLNLIQSFVEAEGHDFLRLDGSTPTRTRQELVDKFQNDESIFLFLMSTKAGGLGLNLTAANVVIVFDVDFNPSNDEQAQDRAYRIGQKKNVRVIRLVSRGTIEELKYIRQIYKVQLKKETLGNVHNDNDIESSRMFRGVQGDKDRKGELFGLENLLKYKDGSFIEDVWKPTVEPDGRLRGFEKFDLRNSCQLVEELQSMSSADVENIGGDLEFAGMEHAARKEERSAREDNTNEGKIEDLLGADNAVKHQDFMRSDRGRALLEEGDEGFEEERGGESQAMHDVLEYAELEEHGEPNTETGSASIEPMRPQSPAVFADISPSVSDPSTVSGSKPSKKTRVVETVPPPNWNRFPTQSIVGVCNSSIHQPEPNGFIGGSADAQMEKPDRTKSIPKPAKRKPLDPPSTKTMFTTKDLYLPSYMKKKKKKSKYS